ncbi:hypothetical protein TPHA_0K00920 [Tetrapisispora phaffii CBS 4417]|uniref:Uncharacterized protein n=1 Tax=Tetrapisispora phaffii (strain ATCC 24235 / CBS 4417 / NBRC 1672 / NRRL Y-8282 / UCD 70-5) TaxID=1071381 RepID=G8BZ98_TETPH|nr:hypothetical protein TPHA_0K00920 [Tetrapisispora phaffii CBS 4417]CCE65226.1 hypothetical protein TPHA_0K00920 [Tetrapisispora phaffii CBS 4417]
MVALVPIFPSNTPSPAASYSPAMKAGDTIYLSGQIHLNEDNKLVGGSIADKAEQIFENVQKVLAAANSDLDHVVKCNVFLKDIKDFAEFNTVYAKYFNSHKPARSCVAVAALPLNADVEMECIAVEKK